ncbi:MAG: UvrB/UvrC motif-containing protein [Planctomycetaceae bacterium]|jgi:protein arginine kinase activator|nr:UvrB/UvrC motif-containing protein [Planctomycetaceae bacterium]
MKCKKCERPATFHITELVEGSPKELHLCEDHARDYLSETSEAGNQVSGLAAALAQNVAAKQFVLNETNEELKSIDQTTCPICGISFFDFRSRGRLGCPNDYVCFAEQLEPLIQNIHGESQHIGKVPKRSGTDADHRTKLIKLRRDLEDAVRYEEYERASKLRDQIKEIEVAQ